jgi:ribosome-associated protein
MAIEITPTLRIPQDELGFRASRSSGPGGQNVNKLNTRMTLLFDVSASPSLSEAQKRRLRSKLSTRIDKQGVLRVVAQCHRSQEANRRAATERFQALMRDALKRKPPRKKTRVPARAREKRLREKRQRSLLKQERAKNRGRGRGQE